MSILGDLVPSYAFVQSGRSIASLIPDCAIREIHRDELQLTMHPLIEGTPTTDHAFLMPQGVELYWGWSDSSAQSEGYVLEVYQQLLALQQGRQPLSISTGKRQYDSMQIRMLQVITDETSEHSLIGVAVCQQLIITSSSMMTSTSPNSNGKQQVSPQYAPTGAGSAGAPGWDPVTNPAIGAGAAGASGWDPVTFPAMPVDGGSPALIPATTKVVPLGFEQ